ncbi:Putative peptidase S8/S53 domain, peptidase S53, activation domain-containing protein [Septoria linicola]|uniref:tripeptidyl-peptidase II n=1 Tax=Septoria linicola TaxID=215465 RepID=A0A9Q9AHF9_9PEZI|nr:Putative peptidase S8/S53 domain, peptidase S53, activation domain-containing protein [Septoria linicola]
MGPSSKRDTLHLQIGLTQQNPGLIEQHLLEISDPKHERYGKHLSQQDIDDIVAPSKDSTVFVESWLQEHGITEYSHNKAKTMIHCAVPIGKVEALLNTTYYAYKHHDGSEINRAPEWSLPEHLHDHIDIVQPTTSFFHPKKQVAPDSSAWHDVSWWQEQGQKEYPKAYAGSTDGKYGQSYGSNTIGPQTPHQGGQPQQDSEPSQGGQTGGQPQQGGRAGQAGFQPSQGGNVGGTIDVSSVCQVDMVTSQCKRTLYGTIDYVPQAPDRLSVATANYLNETVIRSDISAYMQMFRPDASNAGNEINLVSVASGDIAQELTQVKIGEGTNKEANLDAMNLWSIAYPIPLTAYHTGGSPPFQASLSTPENTNEPYLDWLDYVLSQDELPQVISTSYGDDEQTVPKSYADRVCQGFAQLGARGITLLLSSGDNGVGKDDTCVSNDGSNKQQFSAVFPGSCPWVTTVGATENFQPEVAVSRFASGGGFSYYFDQPDYQRDTVQNYIASLNGQYQGAYNPNGRGYPDVAAQGNHDAIVWNGEVSTIGGTSASAPTFAGVIALVNDALIAASKPPLGFLNPWLYSEGYQALTDIVSGSSFGCGTKGFPAQQGWDAVTGFGTPNFSKLVQAALNKTSEQSGQDATNQEQQQGGSKEEQQQGSDDEEQQQQHGPQRPS